MKITLAFELLAQRSWLFNYEDDTTIFLQLGSLKEDCSNGRDGGPTFRCSSNKSYMVLITFHKILKFWSHYWQLCIFKWQRYNKSKKGPYTMKISFFYNWVTCVLQTKDGALFCTKHQVYSPFSTFSFVSWDRHETDSTPRSHVVLCFSVHWYLEETIRSTVNKSLW